METSYNTFNDGTSFIGEEVDFINDEKTTC
jgi:hypothetical protein